MDDLSSRILVAKSMDEIDALLEGAFIESEVEFIGELDISEDAFEKIKEVLRSECLVYDRIHPYRLRPAIFVTSLVFSARYSQDAIRSFWRPYAHDVWDIGYSDEFYRECRSVFSDHGVIWPLNLILISTAEPTAMLFTRFIDMQSFQDIYTMISRAGF